MVSFVVESPYGGDKSSKTYAANPSPYVHFRNKCFCAVFLGDESEAGGLGANENSS